MSEMTAYQRLMSQRNSSASAIQSNPQTAYEKLLAQRYNMGGYVNDAYQSVYDDMVSSGGKYISTFENSVNQYSSSKGYVGEDEVRGFEKWVYSNYGYDPALINQYFGTLARQYNYNKSRNDAGLFAIEFTDPAYNPDQFSTLQNEYYQYVTNKAGKKADPRMAEYNFPDWVNSEYAKKDKTVANLYGVDYKEGLELPQYDYDFDAMGYGYDMTDEDDVARKNLGIPSKAFLDLYESEEELLTGEDPYEVQATQRFADDLESFANEADRYFKQQVMAGEEVTEEGVREIFDKYDSLNNTSSVQQRVLDELNFDENFVYDLVSKMQREADKYAPVSSQTENPERQNIWGRFGDWVTNLLNQKDELAFTADDLDELYAKRDAGTATGIEASRLNQQIRMAESDKTRKDKIAKSVEDADKAHQESVARIETELSSAGQTIEKVKENSDYNKVVNDAQQQAESVEITARKADPQAFADAVAYYAASALDGIGDESKYDAAVRFIAKTFSKHYLEQLTDDDMRVILYLYGSGRANEIGSMLMTMQPILEKRGFDEAIQTVSDEVNGSGIGGEIKAGLLSVLHNMTAFTAFAETGVNALTGTDTNPLSYSQLSATASSDYTEAAVQNQGVVGSIFGSTLISMANMVTMLPMGPTGSLIGMAANAAGVASADAIRKGATTEQAAAYGLVVGVVEAVTEKLPIDNFFSIIGKSTSKAGVMAFIKSSLKQAGIEATEELVSEYADTLWDIKILGEKSDFWQYVNTLVADGMDETEAYNRGVVKFFIENPLASAAGGFMSGAIFGSAGNIISSFRNATNRTADDSTNATTTAQEGTQATQSDLAPDAGVNAQATTEAVTQPTGAATTQAESSAGSVMTFPQGKGEVTVRTVSDEAKQEFTANEQKTMRNITKAGKTLGVNIQWAYSISHTENGTEAADNGMYDPNTDTLYISWDSATADGGSPYVAVLGHEISHSLEDTQTYNTILDYAVQQAKDNGTYEQKIAALQQAYPNNSETYLQQELVSDFVQEVFTNKAELRRLVNSQRGVVGAILNAIDTVLGKFKGGNAEISKLRQMLETALNEKQETATQEVKSMRRGLWNEPSGFSDYAYSVGFIFPDGGTEFLDEPTGQHTDLFRKLQKDNNLSGVDDIYQLINDGVIRTKPGSGIEISMETPPTESQYKEIKKVFNQFDGEKFYVDFSFFGSVATSLEFDAFKSGASTVVDEIKKFYLREVKSSRRKGEIKTSTRTSNIPGSIQENPNIEPDTSKEITKKVKKGTYDYTQVSNKDSLEKARNKYAEKYSIDSAAASIEHMVDSGQRFKAADVAFAEVALMEANKREDKTAFFNIAANLRIIATEMGQGVQIMRLIKKLSPEGRLMGVKRLVEVMQKRIDERYNKNKPENKQVKIEIDRALVENLLNAKTQKEVEVVESVIRREVGQQIPSTLWDKINAWRYMSMLGNIKTNARNIAGNTAMYLLALNKDLNGAIIESISAASGKEFTRSKSFYNPFSKQAKAARAFGFKEADLLMSELSGQGKEENLRQHQRVFKNAVLEWSRTHSFKPLEIVDQKFIALNFAKAMEQYMMANNLTPSKMTGKALDTGVEIATKEALRNTFRDLSSAAHFLNTISKNDSLAWRIAGVGVEGVMPFKQTPINILKRGVEYSPVGIIGALYNVKKGKITTQQFIDGAAASLSGTALLGVGMLLASLGVIRASGEDRDREEYFDELKGHQVYSLEIGEYSMTLDWLTPVNMPLFVGVEMHDIISNSGSEVSPFRVLEALTTTIDPLLQLSMLKGINDALGTYSSEDNALSNLAESAAYGYASQFFPTLLGQIARTFDSTRRSTYAAKDSYWTKQGEQFLRKVIAKIPGLSHVLEPYIDMWGEEDQGTRNFALRAAENFVLPWWGSEINNADPVNMEIERLFNATDDTGILPKYPNNYHSTGGKTYYIQSNEIDDYNRDYGVTARAALENLFDMKIYDRLDDTDKAKVIKKVYEYSQAYAKDNSSLTYTMSDEMSLASEAVDRNISIEKYFLAKRLAADADDTTNISQENAKYAIDQIPGLTREQRAWLYWSMGKQWKTNAYISGYKP